MLINARSLINKIDILRARIISEKPQIIGVTETWAHRDILDRELHVQGYNMIRRDRSNRHKGG